MPEVHSHDYRDNTIYEVVNEVCEKLKTCPNVTVPLVHNLMKKSLREKTTLTSRTIDDYISAGSSKVFLKLTQK